MKKLIWRKYPRYKDDLEKNILLSYGIYGSFYVYLNNQDADPDMLIRVSEKIVKDWRPCLMLKAGRLDKRKASADNITYRYPQGYIAFWESLIFQCQTNRCDDKK